VSISFSELLCGYKESEIPAEHLANLKTLHEKINVLREKFGKPLKVSNAYRSREHHLAIYKKKGITDEKLIPMKSKHLYGQAVDLAGANIKEFQKWMLANTKLLEELGRYLSHCHMVSLPVSCPDKWQKVFSTMKYVRIWKNGDIDIATVIYICQGDINFEALYFDTQDSHNFTWRLDEFLEIWTPLTPLMEALL
jgi:hypothetical protein